MANKTTSYMNYIGSNLKYRQFPTNNHPNTSANLPSSQSLQSSSSKSNAEALDSTHSTQNSSQNHSFTQKEEGKERDLPPKFPFQKNSSPVNFWPLSISPYEEKKQSFPTSSSIAQGNEQKA